MRRVKNALDDSSQLQEPERLPQLRCDLRINHGPNDRSGVPQWVIHDPIQNRYFKIDATTKGLLDTWQCGQTVDEFAQQYAEKTGHPVTGASVRRLISFLHTSKLTTEEGEDWRQLAD